MARLLATRYARFMIIIVIIIMILIMILIMIIMIIRFQDVAGFLPHKNHEKYLVKKSEIAIFLLIRLKRGAGNKKLWGL